MNYNYSPSGEMHFFYLIMYKYTFIEKCKSSHEGLRKVT